MQTRKMRCHVRRPQADPAQSHRHSIIIFVATVGEAEQFGVTEGDTHVLGDSGKPDAPGLG